MLALPPPSRRGDRDRGRLLLLLLGAPPLRTEDDDGGGVVPLRIRITEEKRIETARNEKEEGKRPTWRPRQHPFSLATPARSQARSPALCPLLASVHPSHFRPFPLPRPLGPFARVCRARTLQSQLLTALPCRRGLRRRLRLHKPADRWTSDVSDMHKNNSVRSAVRVFYQAAVAASP